MKKVLSWIMVVLAVLLIPLVDASRKNGLLAGVSADALLSVCALLLIAVFVLYACLYGGIRCSNCGCRINPKYGRRKSFEGRFPCPKCGAMIEM